MASKKAAVAKAPAKTIIKNAKEATKEDVYKTTIKEQNDHVKVLTEKLNEARAETAGVIDENDTIRDLLWDSEQKNGELTARMSTRGAWIILLVGVSAVLALNLFVI